MRRLTGFLLFACGLGGIVQTVKNGPVVHVPHEIMPQTDADWRPLVLFVALMIVGFELLIYTGKGKG